jgi:hypothetical protein
MRNIKKLDDIKLVDIIFWDDTTARTTFDRLQEILGIKNVLRSQVKTYVPVQA